MQRERHRNRKSPQHNLISLFVITFCILLSIFLSIIDPGPLLPPFPPNFSSIDCGSISLLNFVDRDGYYDFVFSAKPSIEYPQEYLPNFLSILIKTTPAQRSYSGEQISNISRDEKQIKFSVIHPFAGKTSIQAYCLDKNVGNLDVYFNPIRNYENDYSYSQDPYSDFAGFGDVCL